MNSADMKQNKNDFKFNMNHFFYYFETDCGTKGAILLKREVKVAQNQWNWVFFLMYYCSQQLNLSSI